MAMMLHQGERSPTMAADNSSPADDFDNGPSIMARLLRMSWPPYLVLALLMGAYLGLNARIDNPEIQAWKPFVWEYSSALIMVALLPLVIRLESRFHVDTRPRGRIIAVHLAGAIAFSATHIVVMVALRKLAYELAGEYYNFGNVPIRAFYELQKDVVSYVLILLAAFAVREFRVRRAGELQAAQLVADLSDARLRHLTAQIEPHFLFNTLNAISNRMREDVDAADRMITHLGNLLRAAYDSGHQVLVPLGSELGWLRGYAAMMVERFRGQLAFDLYVEPGLEAVEVPRLLLQPIVENAIRHGLGDGRGCLSVGVRRVGARIRYTISDDGVGLPDAPLAPGTGLSNVSRRLELLFPNDHTLTFGARAPRGTVVTVSFPVGR